MAFAVIKWKRANRNGNGADSYSSDEAQNMNTLFLREDTEEDVGDLLPGNDESQGQNYTLSASKYVFLSVTDRDGVKGDIARPTHWFLLNVLKVEAFLDEFGCAPGSLVTDALVQPANTCTHALVILSPSFRTREFCVRELNTFMARRRRHDRFIVIPALWGIDNVNGYHPDVDGLVWVENKETRGPADFMIHTLWPALVKALVNKQMSKDMLEEHLAEYIKSKRGGARSIPSSLERFLGKFEHKHGQG